MTDPQWETVLRLVRGESVEPLPVALLVDGMWIADFAGLELLDYFTGEEAWLEANLAAVGRFPGVILMAGFWAEFGMSTNPSAFGAKCVWPAAGFPSPEKILPDYASIDRLRKPDCRTDGLHPFVLKRLAHAAPEMEKAGHRIRLATSHGPLTIASYLLGHTELLVGMKTDPAAVHKLLSIVTEFIIDWLAQQKKRFASIDGVLVLEDLMGFLGEDDFRAFALPLMKAIFSSLEVSVKFLHNDAYGCITAAHLDELGVNLFNFSFQHDLPTVRKLAGPNAVLMGNVPPRDCLAAGSVEDVARAVAQMLHSLDDRRRLVVSAGGFLPPGVSAANLDALCRAADCPLGPPPSP